MFAPLSRLMNAVARLAGTVHHLAGTCADVNASFRTRLQMDAAPEAPAIENEPTEANGTCRRRKRAATP